MGVEKESSKTVLIWGLSTAVVQIVVKLNNLNQNTDDGGCDSFVHYSAFDLWAYQI